jgi:hypothetical protein
MEMCRRLQVRLADLFHLSLPLRESAILPPPGGKMLSLNVVLNTDAAILRDVDCARPLRLRTQLRKFQFVVLKENDRSTTRQSGGFCLANR